MKLILATYNIHRCHGRDGKRDPARTREVLRQLDADIVALQEVELLRNQPGLLDYFCEGRSWTAIHGPTLERANGQYGNAVLTSLPVRSVQKFDISWGRHEPRGALDLALDHERISLRLLATHLGLWPAERRAQIKRLLAELQAGLPGARHSDLTVLMGDLNEWFLWGRPLRMLARHFRPTPAPPTYPARRPMFALDRIWAHPRARLSAIRAISNRLTRQASDHLPLVAELTSPSPEYATQDDRRDNDDAGHDGQHPQRPK